jgi:mannose-6-phosphate isomerase
MVWGGRRLGTVLHKELAKDEAYGESWEISDHPLHRSVVASGPRAGQTLRQLMEQESALLLGPQAESHAVFPWLVKFLDACDWLSVQVHPNEEAVGRLWPGEGSKTEAWFVLDAAPGSRIYAGLLPGVDEPRLREALASGTVADWLHQFEPRSGDCVFLPAGTVHAVGGGVLMAEVQQTSDATFRLFDWNRRDAQGKARQLHIEEALASINWNQGPVSPIRTPARALPEMEPPIYQDLVQCPYFDLEYIQTRQPFPCGDMSQLQVLIVLQGNGQWDGPECAEELCAGQAWVLPACLPALECVPQPELRFLLGSLT